MTHESVPIPHRYQKGAPHSSSFSGQETSFRPKNSDSTIAWFLSPAPILAILLRPAGSTKQKKAPTCRGLQLVTQ
jgi:hypothetical protein